MKQDVIISIKGLQSGESGGEEPIELVTAGKLEPLGGERYTLSYQESEVTGFAGTLTTIQVEPSRVTLQRVGAVNSQMVFEEGRRHLSMYDTPYGALSVGIHTRRMRSTLDGDGGEVEVHYGLEIEHGAVGQSVFHINVRRAAAQAGTRKRVTAKEERAR